MNALSDRRRRIAGWGFEGENFEPSPQLIEWLTVNVGPCGPALSDAGLRIPETPPRSLPSLPLEVSTDSRDRFRHARGQGLIDVVRQRSGTTTTLPDAVVRPSSGDDVMALFEACKGSGVRIVPWGGGTSVTGGVNTPSGEAPVISVDLERMAGLKAFDSTSGLAVFGPGTTGPQVESALVLHGHTLGHYPQSWELATVGGWAATRSSGQESLGFGRIEDLVAGMDVVAPAGHWRLPAMPSSAAGPDLRHLVMGSEGRFGIITEATLRTRPTPGQTVVQAFLAPDLDHGLQAIRSLTWSGLRLCMLRLSDAPETAVAMAIGLGASRFASIARTYLGLRGIKDEACLILVGANGTEIEIAEALAGARSILASQRAVSLGRGPGRHWQRDRFRHPYLREALLDRGWATDTLETAVPWSGAARCRTEVSRALESALETEHERVAVLCHVSHPYIDGTSLYFTFFFRTGPDPEATVERWAVLKRKASEALVKTGATISHHHGVGTWHAPWLEKETGPLGLEVLGDTALRMDPEGILNPHVLLDPTDRLKE